MQTVNFNAIEKLDFRTKESYKTLRTNLEFSGRDRKVISVTSCTPNEGKTSVSFQLALSVAEGGKRVVLVDADLRKSVLKGRYKTNASRYGLSHYLSGQASIADVTLSLIHISEPTRLGMISYAVFCLKKKIRIAT